MDSFVADGNSIYGNHDTNLKCVKMHFRKLIRSLKG